MKIVKFNKNVCGIVCYTRCPFGYMVPSSLPWVALVGHFYCSQCRDHISRDFETGTVHCGRREGYNYV